MVTKTLFRQFPGVQSCRLFLDAAAGMGDDDGGILQGGIKPVGKIDEGRHHDTLTVPVRERNFLLLHSKPVPAHPHHSPDQ